MITHTRDILIICKRYFVTDWLANFSGNMREIFCLFENVPLGYNQTVRDDLRVVFFLEL